MTDPGTSEPRTYFRDARLHKALAQAPDRETLPASGTRDAIKNKATYALSTRARAGFDAKKPWWKVFWERIGHASGPWNAAFATLLLGGIITLIWHGQDVPDAGLDERPAVANGAPRAAATALPAPAPAKDEVTPAVAPTPAPAPAPGARPETEAREKRASPPAQPLNADKPSGELARDSQKAQAPVRPAAMPSPAPAPAPAPAAAAAAAAGVPLGSVEPLVDRMEDSGRANAINRTPIASGLAASLLPGEWTQTDLAYQGRTVRLAKRDAQPLVNRALALVAASAATTAPAPQGAPLLSVQLLNEDNAVARFDVWGTAFRWQRAGQPDLVGSLTPGAVSSLLADAARALPP